MMRDTVRDQMKHDWRDHVQFTSIVVGAAIDGREAQRRAALPRLMRNAADIAAHIGGTARSFGKAFDADALAELLREHVRIDERVVAQTMKVLAPATAMPRDVDYEAMLRRGVFTPMREALRVMGGNEVPRDRLAVAITENGRRVMQGLVEIARVLSPLRAQREVEAEADRLVWILYEWYGNAARIGSQLSDLPSASRRSAATRAAIVDAFYAHIEQLAVEMLRYYFRRYEAWVEALDTSNAHMEHFADEIATMIAE